MESSHRIVEASQGARGEAALTLGSGNSLHGSTSRLEVESLLAEKTADAVKASKLEEEVAWLREALNALALRKVRRRTAVFM